MRDIVYEWVEYLKNECLMGNDDPLFPKTKMSQNSYYDFQVSGVAREHWCDASAVRKIFKDSFTLAELPNFNPHGFRNTLVSLGEQLCHTAEEFKAWSQNLGHDGVLTTFYSYGEVQQSRQVDIFKQLKEPRLSATSPDVAELASQISEK